MGELANPHYDINSAWWQDRCRGIGGSDVAAILGLSRFRTPLQVYQEKRGEIGPSEDNWRMLMGRTLEPQIRQFYADTTGRQVYVPKKVIVSDEHPFMLANLDGYTDCPRVVEIKWTQAGRDYGEPGTDQIPQEVMCQVQHYMIVTGFVVADVVASIGNNEPQIYTVEADKELAEMIIQAEAEFWEKVKKGEPPEPITLAEATQKYGKLRAQGAVEASKEVEQAVYSLKKIQGKLRHFEEEEKNLKTKIIKSFAEMGDTLVSNGKILATYRIPKPSTRFDADSFKVAHSDLYDQFLKTAENTRRFLLK